MQTEPRVVPGGAASTGAAALIVWRGLVIVVLAVGSFLIFPLECSGPEEGPARCRSVAGLTYSPGWVVAGLWLALAAALVWLGVAKLRSDRGPPRS